MMKKFIEWEDNNQKLQSQHAIVKQRKFAEINPIQSSHAMTLQNSRYLTVQKSSDEDS